MATTERDTDGPTELRPFEEQEPFLRADHRYYGYVSGVGAGKTYAGILRTALNMLEWNPGEMGAIVAPTTTMAKDVILPLMRDMGLLEHWEYRSMHADEPGIHVPNGSRALLLSADNRRQIERLAGLNLAWYWLDEASRVAERAHDILMQRIREGDYQNGYYTTTPRGRDYVYRFFVADYDAANEYTHGTADVYEHPDSDRLAILRVPTWANPYTGEEYKADMRAKEGQVYEREVLGRFVEYEGLVYPWFDPDTHVVADIEGNVRRVMYGVDWGHTNPFAVVVVGLTTRDEYAVLDEVYQSGLDFNEMVQIANGLEAEYGRGRWYCDTNEPAAIQMFQDAGLDAVKAEKAIMPGIQYVSAQRDRLRVHAECVNLRDEFTLYHYPDQGDGETPVDANNHLLDALRYALMTESGDPSTGILGADPEYL